jgi:hypothetical protein
MNDDKQMERALQVFKGEGLPCKYLLSEVALVLPDGVELSTVERMLSAFSTVTESLRFWIGDLLVYAERNYGEKIWQMVDEGRFSFKSISDMMWVSKAVPPNVRRRELSWSHHREVAKLDAGKQEECLKKAVDGKLSVRDLHTLVYGPKPTKEEGKIEAFERALYAVVNEAKGSGLMSKELFEDRLEEGKALSPEQLVITRMAIIAQDAIRAYA